LRKRPASSLRFKNFLSRRQHKTWSNGDVSTKKAASCSGRLLPLQTVQSRTLWTLKENNMDHGAVCRITGAAPTKTTSVLATRGQASETSTLPLLQLFLS
jgi:hypothetical protein